jgi:hypothetical protein
MLLESPYLTLLINTFNGIDVDPACSRAALCQASFTLTISTQIIFLVGLLAFIWESKRFAC